MSNYFLLQGKSDFLTVDLFPPLHLDPESEYVLGLDYFTSVNSLKNVTRKNNKFVYYIGLTEEDRTYLGNRRKNFEQNVVKDNDKEIYSIQTLNDNDDQPKLETQFYNVDSLTNTLEGIQDAYQWEISYLRRQPHIKEHVLELEPGAYEYEGLMRLLWDTENSSLTKTAFNVEVQESGKFKFITDGSVAIDFKVSRIGELLGAEEKLYWKTETAKNVFNIWDINTLQIYCNLVEGAFINNQQTHLIYSFPLLDESGQLIVEKPNHILYFPINTNIISTISIVVTDQKQRRVDFGVEEISVAIHLKKQ